MISYQMSNNFHYHVLVTFSPVHFCL